MSYEMEGEPAPEGQLINELHVWIGIHANGGEGILSADLPLFPNRPDSVRHVPLISSKRATAEGLADLARQVQREAMHTKARFVRIELRSFRREQCPKSD